MPFSFMGNARFLALLGILCSYLPNKGGIRSVALHIFFFCGQGVQFLLSAQSDGSCYSNLYCLALLSLVVI